MTDEDWTGPVRAAHVGVAVAAVNLRLLERRNASEDLKAVARQHLFEALDELESVAPAMFAELASQDEADVGRWRDDGGPVDAWGEGRGWTGLARTPRPVPRAMAESEIRY